MKDWGDQIKPLSNEDTAGDLSQPKLNPQQFSISELFWVLVLVALVLAIATPFVRKLSPAVFNAIIIVVIFQRQPSINMLQDRSKWLFFIHA